MVSIKQLIFFCALLFFSLVVGVSQVSAASIGLQLSKRIEGEDLVEIEVYLDTELQQTIGTDLLFTYEPTELEFVSAKPGELYPNYHDPRVDTVKKQIRYSGTAQFNKYEAKSGLFATLVFRRLINVDTELALVWSEDATNETNVVSAEGKELLSTQPQPLTIKKGKEKVGKVAGIADDDSQSGDILGEATYITGSYAWFYWLLGMIVLGGVFVIWKKRQKLSVTNTPVQDSERTVND